MDVLITGAGGRIGSQVARRLSADGHRIRAMDLQRSAEIDELATLGAEIVLGGLGDRTLLAQACDGVDAVVHTGAALSSAGPSDDLLVEANVVGTYHLLDAVRSRAPGIRRFVYLSSDAVYWAGGSTPAAALPVDEHLRRAAGSVYGATKVAAEQLTTAFLHSYGIPTVIARPTATAAPAELITPASVFGRRWFTGGALAWAAGRAAPTPAEQDVRRLLGECGARNDDLFLQVDTAGASTVSMINDSRDVADGICRMLEPPQAVGHAFNLGSTEFSDAALVGHVAQRLGRTVHTIAPARLRPSWYLSSAKARSLLGYQPQHTVFDMVDEALVCTDEAASNPTQHFGESR